MLKVMAKLFNIAPIELKFVLWTKGGKVNIPTKFKENMRTLSFLVKFMHYVIFYFHASEMYRLYRTKLYGPVMVNLYKENDVFMEIMGTGLILFHKIWICGRA